MKKITQEEYFKFLADYDQKNLYPNQRLGQAFCNKFDIEDSELFYKHDNYLSSIYIADYFVEF